MKSLLELYKPQISEICQNFVSFYIIVVKKINKTFCNSKDKRKVSHTFSGNSDPGDFFTEPVKAYFNQINGSHICHDVRFRKTRLISEH